MKKLYVQPNAKVADSKFGLSVICTSDPYWNLGGGGEGASDNRGDEGVPPKDGGSALSKNRFYQD